MLSQLSAKNSDHRLYYSIKLWLTKIKMTSKSKVFSQFTTGLVAFSTKLYHSTIKNKVRKSALAEANEKRD